MPKRIEIEDDVLIQAYQETKSPSAVARRFGISTNTLERRLTKHGIKRIGQRGLPRKLPPTIVSEYEAGASMNSIARKYACNLATVAEALHRAGFTARKRGGTRQEIKAETRDRLVALYREHGSITRAAELAKTSYSKAYTALFEAGEISKNNKRVGNKHSMWRGGVTRNAEGYLLEMVGAADPLRSMARAAGYVPQHRLVVARFLGRPLEARETVHHINGNKADNRLENLQLRQGSHGTGVVHRCKDCGSVNIETARLN